MDAVQAEHAAPAFGPPATNALDCARYFIHRAQDDGQPITNLKLQKVLYYAYAWYLTDNRSRLFGDEIQAWRHGPVIPNVYFEYRRFGWEPITIAGPVPELPPGVRSFLDEIWDDFGRESAVVLRQMTHQETPWVDAWNSREAGAESCNESICDDAIFTYFSALQNA
jgi:uncharacterized phage-associated protein